MCHLQLLLVLLFDIYIYIYIYISLYISLSIFPYFMLLVRNTLRTFKIAQQIKVLAKKPGDLSLIPGTHIVEGENQLHQVILWPSTLQHGICSPPSPMPMHTHADVPMCTHMHILCAYTLLKAHTPHTFWGNFSKREISELVVI